MNRGYIKLWRCIQDNHLWTVEEFSRGQAWIDLLMLANHKQGSLRKRGILINVDRGQVGWSERELAERWKWSRGKVRRFLKELENETKIVQQNGPQNINVTSLISIVNYEKYQSEEPQNGPQTIPQTGHKRATNSTMEKNEKNEKKEPADNIPYHEILNMLNEALGTSYKATTDAHRRDISARWREGHRIPDFQKVISTKSKAWRNDPKMAVYLRPSTLFGTKFESYLNEVSVKPQTTEEKHGIFYGY